MPSRLTIVRDDVAKVVADINELVAHRVLVGIPESSSARSAEGPINNATIGYLMETGMPAQNVPARPSLVPGVRAIQGQAIAKLRAAADNALGGRPYMEQLNQAGIIGMNSVRNLINSNIPPPLAPSTIRGRKYARGTASRRPGETRYLNLVRGGMAPGPAQAAAGIIALVNTGQFRNSVTYVVRRLGK